MPLCWQYGACDAHFANGGVSLAGMNVSASVRRRQLEAERPGRRIGGGRAGFWGGHFFHGHCVVGARKNCACKAKNTRPVGGQRAETYW